MRKLDDKTTIPLFAALITLPVIVGFIFWLSSVDAKATKGAEAKEILYQMALDIQTIKSDVNYLKERK